MKLINCFIYTRFAKARGLCCQSCSQNSKIRFECKTAVSFIHSAAAPSGTQHPDPNPASARLNWLLEVILSAAISTADGGASHVGDGGVLNACFERQPADRVTILLWAACSVWLFFGAVWQSVWQRVAACDSVWYLVTWTGMSYTVKK